MVAGLLGNSLPICGVIDCRLKLSVVDESESGI